MRPDDFIAPKPEGFAADPFGYSALAWHKWGMAQTLAGLPVDLKKGPTSEDLKSPVLWFSHAHAMSQAARVLLQDCPAFEAMPPSVRGITHCQYHAIALMLVGYSLEICLKAMLITHKGVPAYQSEERKHYHHSLEKLAEFIPNLSAKDISVLTCLSHFVKWAGRYPDPGFGRLTNADEIFSLSESNAVSARDLFELAQRIMAHSKQVISDAHGG
jgi:hypothetical protein